MPRDSGSGGEIDLRDVVFDVYTAGLTSPTTVVVTHRPTGCVATATMRGRRRAREEALRRLAPQLADWTPPLTREDVAERPLVALPVTTGVISATQITATKIDAEQITVDPERGARIRRVAARLMDERPDLSQEEIARRAVEEGWDPPEAA